MERYIFTVEFLGSRKDAMRKIEIQYPCSFFFSPDSNKEHSRVIRFNTGDTVHLPAEVARTLKAVPGLSHPVWQE